MRDIAQTHRVGAALAVSEQRFGRAYAGDPAMGGGRVESRPYANLPNAITTIGYMGGLAWIAGAPWMFAVGSLLADELDGRIARATGQTTDTGKELDWTVDITLTGLCAMRAGLLWTLPITTIIQSEMKRRGVRPKVGSARAAYTIFALFR